MLLSILVADGILSSFGSALMGSAATTLATIIVGGIVMIIKKPFATYKENKIKKEEEKRQSFMNDIVQVVSTKENQENAKLQTQIDGLKEAVGTITAGVLSIQGREFKKHCRDLLDKPYMTETEFVEITKDYKAYKAMDGNGEGDILYNDLKAKHDAQLAAEATVAVQQAAQKN